MISILGFDALQLITVTCVSGVVVLLLGVIYVHMTSSKPNIKRLPGEEYFIDPNKEGHKYPFPSIDDPPSKDLSVIVPAYNETDRMPCMLDEALEHLQLKQKNKVGFSYEIIVVDDGSKDKTTETALLYSERYGTDKVRVLTLAKNRGKGGAVRMGMLSARGKLLLFADADGATKFADVDKLELEISKINTDEHKMAIVCGSRAHLETDSIAKRSLFRTVLMFGFHFLVWFLCVRGVKDTQCGFKLLTRQAAQLLFYNLHVERWAFDVDLLHIAQHFKLPVSEVAVSWTEIEGSKLSPFWATLQMGRDLFLIRLRYMMGAWKMEAKPKRD